jgi:hypothetical protein
MYGYSVGVNEPFIHIMDVYHLDDTTIGQAEQNLTQYIPLFNGSNIAVNYNIDVGDETAEEFGVNILSCLSSEGTIEPGKFSNVPFTFKPLEAREYAMDVFLTVPGTKKKKVITLIGRGVQEVEREISLFTAPLTNYSKSSKLSMQLSESLIDFGKIPLFARKTKTLFLQNTSESNVLFSFNISNSNLFEISPNHGRLKPREYATLTIVYTALPPEKVFYDEVTCSVMLETDSLEFESKMAMFNEMKRRAECEFTITETEPHMSHTASPPEKSYTSLKSLGPKAKLPQIARESTFNRNETIPSINSRASRYRKPAKFNLNQSLPLPKKPDTLLLHVTLTGESEKSSQINSGMTYFNITKNNKQLQQANSNSTVKDHSDSKIYEGEPEIMEDLCGDLIHEILYGSDIINKIEVLDKVEPPKYAQLSDKKIGKFRERENTEPNLFKAILSENCDTKTTVISEKSLPDIPALKMATELIEATFKNIINDAVQEDIQVTEPYMFIGPKD